VGERVLVPLALAVPLPEDDSDFPQLPRFPSREWVASLDDRLPPSNDPSTEGDYLVKRLWEVVYLAWFGL